MPGSSTTMSLPTLQTPQIPKIKPPEQPKPQVQSTYAQQSIKTPLPGGRNAWQTGGAAPLPLATDDTMSRVASDLKASLTKEADLGLTATILGLLLGGGLGAGAAAIPAKLLAGKMGDIGARLAVSRASRSAGNPLGYKAVRDLMRTPEGRAQLEQLIPSAGKAMESGRGLGEAVAWGPGGATMIGGGLLGGIQGAKTMRDLAD